MEYLWYVIAALGAGVGTGLAGLSAATVMVPIFIVLCPSFAGEKGVYHATAVALASDILSSVFTTGIYIKHKNIDLKRGWIMLVCEIGTCIAGSIAAFAVGNVALGTFSLFLCVAIGIRFLVKPDTQRKKMVTKGAKLDWKSISISLFFGLTIGFGTGFVGSGGGMMMLVVFTAFLGMDRKPAVGTSTFIMVFTALIAFVSHVIIDPTILFERWDVLIICIVTSTAGSIVSAQFANKVNNKIVGIVTGAILTVCGVVLLILNYWETIASSDLVWQTLRCMSWFLLFIAGVVVVILTLRLCFKMPREVCRKLLQFPALASIIFMMYVAETWISAVICAVLFTFAVFPILCLLEKWKGYTDLFIERKPGEVKKSLFLLFGTHTILVAFCCGVLNKPYVAVAAIITWGIADTAAALCGKRFGKHHIKLPHADPNKTWEGTTAMAVTTFVICTATLLLVSPLSWYTCMIYSLIIVPFSAGTELYSHNGNDTVSVPVAITAVLSLFILI